MGGVGARLGEYRDFVGALAGKYSFTKVLRVPAAIMRRFGKAVPSFWGAGSRFSGLGGSGCRYNIRVISTNDLYLLVRAEQPMRSGACRRWL